MKIYYMPNWKVHLEIGNRLGKKLNYEKGKLSLFLFGSILPDVNNGYLVDGISEIISHKITHFSEIKFAGYKDFFNKYENELKDSPLFQGYLAHLITDYLWNEFFYTEFYDDNPSLKKMTKEELRILKQKDFKTYDDFFYKNKLLNINEQEIIFNTNKIDEIKINKEDINKIIQYVNTQEQYKNKKFNILNKDILDKLMNNTIIFILNYFREKKIGK